jgi:hypothetical protein
MLSEAEPRLIQPAPAMPAISAIRKILRSDGLPYRHTIIAFNFGGFEPGTFFNKLA